MNGRKKIIGKKGNIFLDIEKKNFKGKNFFFFSEWNAGNKCDRVNNKEISK